MLLCGADVLSTCRPIFTSKWDLDNGVWLFITSTSVWYQWPHSSSTNTQCKFIAGRHYVRIQICIPNDGRCVVLKTEKRKRTVIATFSTPTIIADSIVVMDVGHENLERIGYMYRCSTFSSLKYGSPFSLLDAHREKALTALQTGWPESKLGRGCCQSKWILLTTIAADFRALYFGVGNVSEIHMVLPGITRTRSPSEVASHCAMRPRMHLRT